MLAKNLKEYDEFGFTKVEKFFSSDELIQIENELKIFIETYSKQFKWDEINFTKTGEINSIHRIAGRNAPTGTFFSKLYESEKMLGLARAFLRDEPELRVMELFAKPAKSGLTSPWHQDNFYWCINGGNALTFWAALDVSSIENGGVEYIAGSHLLGILAHQDSFAPGSSQTVADKEWIKSNQSKIECPSLQPGDVLVHHSQTVHGSKDNLSDRARRGLTFQYKGKQSTYNEEMQKHYLDRLNMQVAERMKSAGKKD